MEMLNDIVNKSKVFLTETCSKESDTCKNIQEECADYFKAIDQFLETGDCSLLIPENSEKENVESAVISSNKKGRSRKPALADITENNLQSDLLAIKKEKISNINGKTNVSNKAVQKEKEAEEMPAPAMLPPRKKKIKVENDELPKRSTRTKTKSRKAQENELIIDNETTRSKSSSIIIQNDPITTIDISDSEKDIGTDLEYKESRCTRSKMRKQKKAEPPVADPLNITSEQDHLRESNSVRSTRTKTKHKKRSRSKSAELPSVKLENKKPKCDADNYQDCNQNSEYEDALSEADVNQDKVQPADATYIASSSKNGQSIHEDAVASGINSTVVVENPKMVLGEGSGKGPLENNGMSKSSPKPGDNKGIKQIFSPFDKTPLKKKVEAFERLGVDSNNPTIRVTRTKKKAQKEQDEQEESREKRVNEPNNKSQAEKSKALTPISYKYPPKVCSTSKLSKLHPFYSKDNTSVHNESALSVKSASALKASQAEFRERERRRQEKEREAIRKREALLQAQTEEKRRKREEKQQKAQHQREVLEKEKQKYQEAQRLKEEKLKQVMAEREEKLLKQKEEAEMKRLLAKKKANELLKEKSETIRMEEEKKAAEMKAALDKQGDMVKLALKHKMARAQQQQSIPEYMTTKPPLLPTADCYDSDDSEYERTQNTKRFEPAWAKDSELRDTQLAMITIGESMKNSFFCRQAQTPDLQKIFETIDPRKLKRTSSAIWRKPPRYTLMPLLEDTIEFSEDSD